MRIGSMISETQKFIIEYYWANDSLTDRNGPDRDPIISPDGKSILYTGYDQVQTYQLSKST